MYNTNLIDLISIIVLLLFVVVAEAAAVVVVFLFYATQWRYAVWIQMFIYL